MNIEKRLTNLMLALIFTHELDAVAQSEWRLLYVLRDMGDDPARWYFVALHVPLFWALLGLTQHTQTKLQSLARTGLAAFCVVHALLHLRLRNDPLSTFNSPLSWGLILGAALIGAVYLAVIWFKARPNSRH